MEGTKYPYFLMGGSGPSEYDVQLRVTKLILPSLAQQNPVDSLEDPLETSACWLLFFFSCGRAGGTFCTNRMRPTSIKSQQRLPCARWTGFFDMPGKVTEMEAASNNRVRRQT